MNKIRTTINIALGVFNAAEFEAEIEVTYSVTPGRAQTYTQPGEGATVDIVAITAFDPNGAGYNADWMCDLLADDEDLHVLCLQDATERAIDAEEYRAEARREEIMLAKWENGE